MMMLGAFWVFIMLGISCTLCILAQREKGVLRAAGNSIAASLVVLTIMYVYLITDAELSKTGLRYGRACHKVFHKAMIKK
ncbi:MAG: hypothetical protein NC938_04230 [Candidatus Omnitrophica bacterium]|nr:hypothetical protein [Candidatus Omnitrophota bacterium]